MAFKSLLDSDFQYRNSANTDVRETFERIRREQSLKTEQRRSTESDDARVTWRPEAHTNRSNRAQR